MTVKHNPPLVLVADDEVNTTIMLQRIFEREGYQVERVSDGIAALSAAQDLIPDLILLDIRMPGMSGFDVLRSLREIETTAKIPTILITANAREPADVARGLNLGADDYLYKPFAPQELVARAQSKMKARQLEDALHRRSHELETLLRVSEELNQYLEAGVISRLILDLVLDMLPGEAALIALLNDEGDPSHAEMKRRDGAVTEPPAEEHLAAVFERVGQQAYLWASEEDSLVSAYAYGIAVPLQHVERTFGMLVLCSADTEYAENHLNLLRGVARQAALTLHNAELYEIQANYAQHLEDMVAARTAELKSAQQMLIRSEKLASVGHLAASIAHEINNPLLPITVSLNDLVEDVNNNIPVDIKGIEIIQDSVKRIQRIVSQLLEFTGRRNQSLDPVPVQVNHILEGVVDLNRKFFEKQGMKIVTDLQPLPQMHGNKDQLEQVFMNLTINAQAAMSKGGTLRIHSQTVGDEILIQFVDSGCGIPPEQIDKIFDPFYSTKPNGTGLGLFVTYGIVEGHHGVIEVASKVNKGTTFTIRLPVHPKHIDA